MLRTGALVLLISVGLAAAPADQTAPRSAALATQLTSALQAQKLDAIAAKDPAESDRFVAALFYPNAQLLVVSARVKSAELLEARLRYKQYHDIYVELQGTALPGSSIFFQDMKADGLCTGPDQATDILYAPDGKTIVFDGDWRKRGVSQGEYQRSLTDAERQYSHLLELLLAQARPA